jgi:RimJ/RimL family protein N-acetyltransferase
MRQIVETDRLILREFNSTDTLFIVELLNSPGWLQFIGDRNVKTEEAAKNYLLNGPIKSYKENGFGLCLVETKEGHIPIGMCGILKRDTLPNPDIGFAFLPEYNGMGYAFEMAKATLNHAINQLRLPLISAITIANNSRSIRLLEKIGLSYHKVIVFPGSEEELLLFDNDQNRARVAMKTQEATVNPSS